MNEITKVEFARSGPHGAASVIIIDSSLMYKYYSGRGPTRSHYYNGKISMPFWDTLNKKFKAIETSDGSLIGVDTSFELIIHWKGNTKRIYRSYPSRVYGSLSEFLQSVDNSYKNVKLNEVNDPFKFENDLHFWPPKPKDL
jgi:hypothetical protein